MLKIPARSVPNCRLLKGTQASNENGLLQLFHLVVRVPFLQVTWQAFERS
jgi:hypothetical protein